MSLLSFYDKSVTYSNTPVTSSSTSLGNDSYASKSFNIDSSKVALIVYQVCNDNGATFYNGGMQNAINVDGTDRAISWDTPYDTNYPCRNTVFWLGTLAAGSHTITGRFASMAGGSTVTISSRTLLVYLFNGDEFTYVDSATLDTVTGTTFANDDPAVATFTPSGSCKMLVLYNASNSGATQGAYGKRTLIRVGASDYSQAEKSPVTDDYPCSVFTAWAQSLNAVSTTVQGRHSGNYAGQVSTINRRQLGVLLLDNTTELDTITSDTQVSVASSSLSNDTQALITKTTTVTSELLVFAMGTKRESTLSTEYGEAYAIQINGSDRRYSRGSPGTNYRSSSASVVWAETIAIASNNTIRGRFCRNGGSASGVIDSRRIFALWFIPPGPSPKDGFVDHANPGIL
jgi:hypothetical protein